MKYILRFLILLTYLNASAQSNSLEDNESLQSARSNENSNSYRSLKALKDAIVSSQKPNNRIDTSVINQLNRCAAECISNSELENAKGFYTLALKQGKKQNYWRGMADALYLQGEYQLRIGQFDASIYSFTCAKTYYQIAIENDKEELKQIADNIKWIYYFKGDVAMAHYLSVKNGEKLTFLETDNILFFGLYIGALLFCFVYNLFLYRFTHDISYKELAKCIVAFLVFIYTTNNDFASHFSRNQIHFSIIEFFKNNSIFFATYYFATFIENLLASRKGVLTRFYRFIKTYKWLVIVWAIASNCLLVIFAFENKNNPFTYYTLFLKWWGWNNPMGLFASIIFFTFLFILTFKKKVKLNYLIYGFVFNILFLSLAFIQASVGNKFSHIPYPHALGSVIFLIFMTVAITDKINLYRQEKEDAQANALKHLEKIVAERTFDLKQQKAVVEEKNKEITDSMTYAKRLQQAILPPLHFISEHIAENFVIYKPKDIVAGDFYWCEAFTQELTKGNKKGSDADCILIAVADCTGHGVPGAMVSVVCSNALNRTVKEFGITEPGKALDKTRELVLETFERSESEVKDGMDISLLSINKKTKEIAWSGANNPLWYIDGGELKEIKADKQPIGKTEYPKPFTTHKITYSKGSVFYLFTDGLSDQFGGPTGKKFKYKQLKEILVSSATLSLTEQSKLISEKFDNWKGKLEQVDDVCIIGIRL